MLCGLAVLAKGLAGLGLPVIVFVAYLAVHLELAAAAARADPARAAAGRRWRCAVVAVPWHHAMHIRHGGAWWNELFGDNHWRRMVLGRHGDRGTFEYFLRELGYCAAALAGAGAGGPGRRGHAPGRGTTCAGRRCYWLGAIWFVAAYAVVSMSMTKFHHYILPALPGLAIVIGCFLDELWAQPRRQRGRCWWRWSALPLLALVVQDLVERQERRAAVPLAVLLRLRAQPARPALARPAGLLARR